MKYDSIARRNLFIYCFGEMTTGSFFGPGMMPELFTQCSTCLSQVYCRM